MNYKKGKQTKQFIIQQASHLFNTRGYAASSISDVMYVTGLKKGGIYNHFESKEELSIAAFEYSTQVLGEYYQSVTTTEKGCANKLFALANAIEAVAEGRLSPGGCPLMNAAIESDDGDPVLKDRVHLAMGRLLERVRLILRQGIQDGEVRGELDLEYVATVFIATLEGALMLSKLYGNTEHMKRAVRHVKNFINTEVCIMS